MNPYTGSVKWPVRHLRWGGTTHLEAHKWLWQGSTRFCVHSISDLWDSIKFKSILKCIWKGHSWIFQWGTNMSNICIYLDESWHVFFDIFNICKQKNKTFMRFPCLLSPLGRFSMQSDTSFYPRSQRLTASSSAPTSILLSQCQSTEMLPLVQYSCGHTHTFDYKCIPLF